MEAPETSALLSYDLTVNILDVRKFALEKAFASNNRELYLAAVTADDIALVRLIQLLNIEAIGRIEELQGTLSWGGDYVNNPETRGELADAVEQQKLLRQYAEKATTNMRAMAEFRAHVLIDVSTASLMQSLVSWKPGVRKQA